MLQGVKKLYKVIRNVLIIFTLLEITLNMYFHFKDKAATQLWNQEIHEANVYENVDLNIIKDLQKELLDIKTEWTPFLHYRLKQFKGSYNKIDEMGHRKTINLNLKTTSKPYKIFCFGGSTMYSTGARDAFTIPSELSKYIYNSFPNKNIEIINFGCHGYNRITETIQLELELLKKNIPDMVLFYDGVNEVIAAQQNDKAGMPTNILNRKSEYGLTYSLLRKIKLIWNTSKIIRFSRELRPFIGKTKKNTSKQPKHIKITNDIVQNYIKNIEICKIFSEHYGFKIFNFWQPVIHSKKYLSTFETKRSEVEKHRFELLYKKTYKKIENNLILKDSISNFFNISDSFNFNKESIFTDFCHTGEKGNTIIAKKIFTHIESTLKNL